jgi:hypothetical protein
MNKAQARWNIFEALWVSGWTSMAVTLHSMNNPYAHMIAVIGAAVTVGIKTIDTPMMNLLGTPPAPPPAPPKVP